VVGGRGEVRVGELFVLGSSTGSVSTLNEAIASPTDTAVAFVTTHGVLAAGSFMALR
jgi:hypothetical protein